MFGGSEAGQGGVVDSGRAAASSVKPLISTRGGAGLGDAIYLQSVVRHFLQQGYRVEVCCDWPDVFAQLGEGVVVSPFRRERIARLAHYSQRRGVKGTTQFQDCCIQAEIREPVDLRLDWTPQRVPYARYVAGAKPLVVVPMPRAPFDRTDGFGTEFLPDCAAIQKAIDRIGKRAFFVLVGKGKPTHQLRGIDLDLSNKTTVTDLLDLAWCADGFLGFCSFIVPLAESFKQPALIVWSHRGLNSRHEVVRQMTPHKILHRASSRYVIDDMSNRDICRAADAFLDQIASPPVV